MLEFRVLGPLEVRRDGRIVDVRGSKRRAVLALLVLHANETVRTDRLIDDLWGERQPVNAQAALQSHVSRLRKDLGEDVVVTKPWGYVLRAPPQAIDVRRFEHLVEAARPLPARERAARLGTALSLWHGAALADLSHEPALAVEAARLDELRLSVLEQRIDAKLELGEHAEVIPQLEGLVAEHPLRERLRGQLILALYRSGRQAEALETYRETRRVLIDDLGIEPSSELRELERAILRQDPALVSETVEAAPEEGDLEISRWRWPRSPLVAAAVLALTLAGAAVAILATPKRGAPHASAAKVPSAASTSTSKSTSSTGEGRPPLAAVHKPKNRPKPRARKPRPRRHRRPRPVRKHTSTVTTVAKPSTQATTAQPPPKEPPPPPTKKKPKPKEVYWLSDDFADPAFDYAMWHLASHGEGVDAAEVNGRVEFTISPDAVFDPEYGVDKHYGTNCQLIGDFEAVVEFELLAWPAADGVNVTFGAFFSRPNPDGWLAVERAGGHADGAAESYDSNIALNAGAQTADTSGAFRLRRKNGILSTYYRYRTTWVRFGSKRAATPANIVLTFNSGGPLVFGRRTASAAFDNFWATAEDVNCQGFPLPPRKSR